MTPCCAHHEPLLVDFGPASAFATDAALETLYKALGDPPPGDDDQIWRPHESTWIRTLIEAFTRNGMLRIAAIFEELAKAIEARRGKRLNLPEPDRLMSRWTREQLHEVRSYLESKPPETFTMDDWGLAVDFIVQRYLPPESAKTEAAWLAERAVLMGKVAANLEAVAAGKVSRILDHAPELIEGLNPVQRAVMDFGRARTADLIVSLSDAMRHRIKRVILNHQQQVFLGDRTAGDLRTKLRDEFGPMNRDWRRIAVTETGEMMNQGMVASADVGMQLKRVEQYQDACPFCRKIDGKTFTVVSPDKPDKDGDTEVWVGKTNVGRSAAPRKRVGRLLVPREPDELWWVAAGVQHPMCRGRWLRVEGHDDSPFAAKVRAMLRGN